MSVGVVSVGASKKSGRDGVSAGGTASMPHLTRTDFRMCCSISRVTSWFG